MVATNILPDRAIGIVANGSFDLDPASIAAGATGVETAAIPEARVGDFVYVTHRTALTDGVFVTSVRVSVDGTVEIRIINTTAAAEDIANDTWDYLIVRGNVGVPTLG